MSDLTRGIDAAFDFLANTQGHRKPFIAGNVTKYCLLGPFVQTKETRETGLWQKVTNTAELKRADFEALNIAETDAVTVAGRAMKIHIIHDDPSDSTVLVYLKPERS